MYSGQVGLGFIGFPLLTHDPTQTHQKGAKILGWVGSGGSIGLVWVLPTPNFRNGVVGP